MTPQLYEQMVKISARFLTALALPWFLIGCSSFATVKPQRPKLTVQAETALGLGSAASSAEAAQRLVRREPLDALGLSIDAARTAAERVAADPSDAAAIEIYNFAVGRMLEAIDCSGLNPWGGALRVPFEGEDYVLTHRRDARKLWNPALYHMLPADAFKIGGVYMTQRTSRPGIGAAAVAMPRRVLPEAREVFAPDKPYAAVTAIARFDGRNCEIAFESPHLSETTRFGGRNLPLAADFSVPLAAMLDDKENNPKTFGFARYFNPGKFDATAEVARLEPWDPNKTVVLVIHGLTDSQATWTPLINKAKENRFIRENFQFWFFSYPSGYPYPYAAALLRAELDAVFRKFPPKKPIVVIGHSMGGCITRLLLTDVGDRLWIQVFGEPPEKTRISATSRKLLEQSLVFKHRSEIGRAIFMSAPLRGSQVASISLGRLAASLIRLPRWMVTVGQDVMRVVTFREGELRLHRLPNSVDTLAPNNRFVQEINKFPLTPGIPHHVVVGDRGRGDAPNSSDGVVPYWSSHLETAETEKIVPTGHATHQHPEGIEEVLRILKRHAGG